MSAINGPYTAGSVISSSVINARLADIETELTDSKSRSGKGDFSAPSRGADGTVAAPTWSYTSETGSGLYRIGSSDHGFSMAGTKVGEWTANGYRTANGAVATPSLSFFNDTGAGLYRIGSNDIGFAINGAKLVEWTANLQEVSGGVHVLSNASGFPSAGKGLELVYSSGGDNGAIQSYDRTGAAWKPLAIDSSAITLNANSAGTFTVSGTTALTGNTTVAGTFKVGASNVSTISGFTRGGCTLNGASPAVCTATVVSGQTCTASFAGTTAPPASGLRTNNAAGTLSVYGANGSTEGVNYTCF